MKRNADNIAFIADVRERMRRAREIMERGKSRVNVGKRRQNGIWPKNDALRCRRIADREVGKGDIWELKSKIAL